MKLAVKFSCEYFKNIPVRMSINITVNNMESIYDI